MGFDPNKPYKANKVDYANIIFALIINLRALQLRCVCFASLR